MSSRPSIRFRTEGAMESHGEVKLLNFKPAFLSLPVQIAHAFRRSMILCRRVTKEEMPMAETERSGDQSLCDGTTVRFRCMSASEAINIETERKLRPPIPAHLSTAPGVLLMTIRHIISIPCAEAREGRGLRRPFVRMNRCQRSILVVADTCAKGLPSMRVKSQNIGQS